MSHWGYVALGWAVTAAGLGTYVAVLVKRGRMLSRRVPPGERRWM